MVRCAFAFACVLFFLSCARPAFVRLGEPGGPPVYAGRYPGPVEILNDLHPVTRRAEARVREVSRNEDVLRRLVRAQYDVKQPLEFRYKYTGRDTVTNRSIARWFAFAFEPKEIAGWEVFIAWDAGGGLVGAWVNALPLE